MIIIVKMSFIINKVGTFSYIKNYDLDSKIEKQILMLPCDAYILWKLFLFQSKTNKPNVYLSS